uniref:Uncharacterized protein n=1 Tax=Leptobrachium leishanense TaxID=445787 RepID=A0A8C5PPZ7_9ANUR
MILRDDISCCRVNSVVTAKSYCVTLECSEEVSDHPSVYSCTFRDLVQSLLLSKPLNVG